MVERSPPREMADADRCTQASFPAALAESRNAPPLQQLGNSPGPSQLSPACYLLATNSRVPPTLIKRGEKPRSLLAWPTHSPSFGASRDLLDSGSSKWHDSYNQE